MLMFFKKRSYDIVKMFINQLAISIFGMALALATGTNQETLRNVTSIFSIAFYLFLIYVMVWDLGAKDSHKIEKGEAGQTRATGLFLALAASLINVLLAVFIMLGSLVPALGNLGAIAKVIALLTEGMYAGLLAITVDGVALNTVWYMYFLLPIPLIITSSLAYIFGSKNLKFFSKKK